MRTILYGPYIRDTSKGTGTCEVQGINTLKRRTTHFQSVLKTRGKNYIEVCQCSFDMTTKDAANSFALALEAKKYLRHGSHAYSLYHNEIVIKAWNDNFPEKLPIEAFFYISGCIKGRNDAFQYQRDYLRLTNVTIPVVVFRLPTANDPNLYVNAFYS